MEDKPNSASVTTLPCQCGYLQRATDDPDIPIVFDADTNEYHITSVDHRGHSLIYHCPFCGGAAPPSKRDSFFATVTADETERLRNLGSGLKTVAEAVAKLGQPDHDNAEGMTISTPASPTEPPKATAYRTMTFSRLSATADLVLIDDRSNRGLGVIVRPKYVGKPKPTP